MMALIINVYVFNVVSVELNCFTQVNARCLKAKSMFLQPLQCMLFDLPIDLPISLVGYFTFAQSEIQFGHAAFDSSLSAIHMEYVS